MTEKQQRKHTGRNSDLSFAWLTTGNGPHWEHWRSLMASWIVTQHKGTGLKIRSLLSFTDFLFKVPNGHSPVDFFDAATKNILPDFNAKLAESNNAVNVVRTMNYVVEFIDWVIANHFSEPDDKGRSLPLVNNPFDKASKTGLNNTESVHNPLPYTFIRELRQILCPKPLGDFREWEWAQQMSGQDRHDGKSAAKTGDWFTVDPSLIDKSDPDCVWRIRTVLKEEKGIGRRKITPHQLWSPVRAVALLVKLHLPLRTYQVRLLDSGEADTWRYERGEWVLNNKHGFKNGSEKNPWNRGVFCRIRSADIGEIMTGLYINTNKTADKNKDDRERGYTIPWQHQEVLYWLEKLRNWQEKYNPIDQPTSCLALEAKHFGNLKSEQQRRDMGSMCFLFRDPCGKGDDSTKPIPATILARLWYQLLNALEDQVAARGQTMSNGSRLRFVQEYPPGVNIKVGTEFPLHSLRVSLLTCYAMEGQVPMPVLSKLLAGHSRLLMTLYYTKPTPAMMSQAMDMATLKVGQAEKETLLVFLKDADLRQITSKTAYRDEKSLEVALANRNPVGWEYRHIGLCLVGGNTAKSDEVGTVAGCWNGGEYINSMMYGPVPNGPENCVRCRWFVTDASYLDALRAHFNNTSYRASLAANLAVEHEQLRDELLEVRYRATEQGIPFLQEHDLQQCERRYEKQIVLADQLARDLVACFQLIGRLMAIEEGRAEGDDGTKLVAVGSMQDIHQPISFIETDSELLQLAQICEDAEIYPDLADELRKTPAIEKRSRALNRLLMQNGYAPVFMQMDESMQLIAGNAMMRKMAHQASSLDQLEGFKCVAGMMEAGQQLNLLPSGVAALEEVFQGPVIKLTDLIATSSKGRGELIHG